MRKIKVKNKTIPIIIVILIIMGGIGIYMYTQQQSTKYTLDFEPTSRNDILENCKSLWILDRNLDETAKCFRDSIEPYFSYRLKEDKYNGFGELVTTGGDCWDFTELYKRLARDLGIKYRVYGETKYLRDENGNNVEQLIGHTYIHYLDDENKRWCLLDMMQVACQNYGNSLEVTFVGNTIKLNEQNVCGV